MKPYPAHKSVLNDFLRDERGAILIIATVYLPIIVGFFTLAVDYSYVLRTRNMLQVTAEAAALAATAQLPNQATSCAEAKNYATKNMPVASYGNVLKQNTSNCSDVVLGAWSQTCTPGQNCFVSNASQPCGVLCNAVQVTTRMATANGNALQLAFAPLIGISNLNVNATAIAVYGGPGGPAWNMNIVQDISQSFSTQLTSARAADQALLNCMNTNAPSGSLLGITLFGGHGLAYQAPITVSGTTNGISNYNTLKTDIQNINECDTPGKPNAKPPIPAMPACSGSHVNVGITTAVTAITGAGPQSANARQGMIIVTDGAPNCGSAGGAGCTDASILADSQTAASNAYTKNGIDIFVIHYCASGVCNTGDTNSLKSLVKGNGFYLEAPTPSQISNSMQQICASQPHRLVW